MNIPYRVISIPKFKIINKRLRKIRNPNGYFVTPVSITSMKLGNTEVKDGGLVCNVNLKTVTILDVYKKVKPFLVPVTIISGSLLVWELIK